MSLSTKWGRTPREREPVQRRGQRLDQSRSTAGSMGYSCMNR